jgi:hypothetical protein
MDDRIGIPSRAGQRITTVALGGASLALVCSLFFAWTAYTIVQSSRVTDPLTGSSSRAFSPLPFLQVVESTAKSGQRTLKVGLRIGR